MAKRQEVVVKDVTNVVITGFLEALDCPRSLAVYLLWKYNEHKQLVELETPFTGYSSPETLRDAYVATEFLSKATFLNTGFDLRSVALEKFFAAESCCRDTNRRINSPRLTGAGADLLYAVRCKIEAILGEFDPLEFAKSPAWGPGATLAIKRKLASAETKFSREGGITRDLHDLVSPWFQDMYPAWDTFRWEFCAGCKVTTVPKNAKTDRTIAVEPGMNLWFQKAVGQMLRKRLKRVGIDLKHGQRKHGRLAAVSSVTGELATVDFSAASDTISKALVRELLPDTWYRVMDACRSKYAVLDGRQIELEKFSSMGNGFTFELETLIFYALAQVCCKWVGADRKGVSVYGDDVLLPSIAYEEFVAGAKLFGFSVNQKKSHSTGWFRESCGSHFASGYCCKPYYLKEYVQYEQYKSGGKPPKATQSRLLDSYLSVTKSANQIRRLAHRRGVSHCDVAFHSVWLRLRGIRDLSRVPLIPDGFGDGGFISNFDEACPPVARFGPSTFGWEGFTVRAISRIEECVKLYDRGVLLARLWSGDAASLQPSHDGGEFSLTADRGDENLQLSALRFKTEEGDDLPRGNNAHKAERPPKVRIATSVVPRWYDLGAWTAL